MKFTFTRALAMAVFVVGLATGAHAQQSSPPSVTGAPKMRPCMSEHQSVVAACKSDPCSASCKEAHQQMKACRAANHLPPPTRKEGGGKKSPCAKSPATSPAPGSTPNTPPPAAP